jgi:uncharacterized membrane protein YeaQ/YmgE (transglycosylase-associated protein family)
MDTSNLIAFVVVGIVAGWLASHLMSGRGFGLLGNMTVGLIGSVLGGFVFAFFGIASGGMVGSVFSATVGAALFLFITGLIKKL